jgi:hypothetical protein
LLFLFFLLAMNNLLRRFLSVFRVYCYMLMLFVMLYMLLTSMTVRLTMMN